MSTLLDFRTWLVAVGTVALLGCHARPHRFANLTVVPAPQVSVPGERLNTQLAASLISDALATRFSQAVQYKKLFRPFKTANLFCASNCTSIQFLSVTPLAAPAPPPAPEVQSSLFLRSAERAQAEFVRQIFTRLPAGMSAAEAITTLSKQLADAGKPAKEDNRIRPRVELTISHLLTLPGEWERLQYLAVFFVLHSEDVRFVDTNEFESVVRDIDLGKLTQTAVNSLSATGSMGFGNAPPAGTTVSRPGNVSVTPTFSYAEALERQLKEQLQFRASSIDFGGRVFAIVLKSSQTNKLPTLIRQIVTLQYTNSVSGSRRILNPTYRLGEFTSFQWSDQVIRSAAFLAPSDANVKEPARFLTQATPLYVGVVRRVRNARGVNTTLEDDDDAQYVTQAGVLPPITLDENPKCEYSIHGLLPPRNPVEVRILAPGDPEGRSVAFTSYEAALQFVTALRHRIASVTAVVRKDGLVWDAAQPDLQGSRIVWRLDGAVGGDTLDWTPIDPATLSPREFCPRVPPVSAKPAP